MRTARSLHSFLFLTSLSRKIGSNQFQAYPTWSPWNLQHSRPYCCPRVVDRCAVPRSLFSASPLWLPCPDRFVVQIHFYLIHCRWLRVFPFFRDDASTRHVCYRQKIILAYCSMFPLISPALSFIRWFTLTTFMVMAFSSASRLGQFRPFSRFFFSG